MTRRELNQAISRATDEDVSTVRRRGFQVASQRPDCMNDGDLPAPQFIDWDEMYQAEEQRRALFM